MNVDATLSLLQEPSHHTYPYVFANRTLDDLPFGALVFLFEIGKKENTLLPLSKCAIESHQVDLVYSLVQNLRALNTAICDAKRRASARHSNIKDSFRLDALLPLGKRIMDDFILRLDALVWLDLQGQPGMTKDAQCSIRNGLLGEALGHITQVVIAMENYKSHEGRQPKISPCRAMSDPFTFAKSAPQPPPYIFRGRSLEDLPQFALAYLMKLGQLEGTLLPTPSRLPAHQAELVRELLAELFVVEREIVARSRRAKNAPPVRGRGVRKTLWWKQAEQLQDENIMYIRDALLPKRTSIVYNFTLHFDALIWMELEGIVGGNIDIVAIRGEMLHLVLRSIDSILESLEAVVTREEPEFGEDVYRRTLPERINASLDIYRRSRGLRLCYSY
ncbi:uncharacterized protein FIBRA_02641 [Fibroporia radiculosa]|uniref:Uncharacterized protein n=1 Tax=Fibroporia radiculosa TaxID=599839 RepID=J4GN08_9APHY|nr:uncharacterized protein FIBRA_02641 [Fibroporia radiculosa]CCM00605.1 predicted protein [Fibroporia radiculosa]